MDPGEIQQVGPYQITRFIAEGGMAWVFEVIDPRFDARRALKLLKPEAARGEQFRRFRAEARVLAQIDHPNLVTIFDFGQDAETDCFYYTMTLVDGPSLSEVGTLPFDRAAEIFVQVLSALVSLHRAGIVHRDIKPGNVLIGSDGRAMLGDLGVARHDDSEVAITQTGDAVGTILYMSPEQARGQEVGPASDVYSMGLAFYRVLCGKSVYEDAAEISESSGAEILFYLGSMMHRKEEFRLPFAPEIPSPLRKVITRACRLDQEDRYADAEAMRNALIEAMTKIRARADGGGGIDFRKVAAAAGVLVAIAVGGIIGSQFLDRWRVDQALAEVSEIDRVARELVADAAAVQPPLPIALLTHASDELNLAGSFFSRARLDVEQGDDEAAGTTLRLAREGFERACQEVGIEHFAAEALAAEQTLSKRVDVLRAVRAPEIRPQRWAELEKLVTAMGRAPESRSPCSLAQSQRSSVMLAGEATALALTLEQEMQAEWPKLAESARTDARSALEGAMRARNLSRSARVVAPEYDRVLDRGTRGFRVGESLFSANEFLQAQESFRRAEQDFVESARVAGAVAARGKAGYLLDALSRADEGSARNEGLQVVRRILDEAESFYTAGNWEEAARSYSQAAALFESVSRDVERLQQVGLIGIDAESLREKAMAAGAARSAPDELESADAVRELATAALEEGRLSQATTQFNRATEAYERARDISKKKLDEAQEAAANARATANALPDQGRCELISPSARSACTQGRESLRLGDRGLEGEPDVPSALAHYLAAIATLEPIAETEQVYRADREIARDTSRVVQGADAVRSRVVTEGGAGSAPIAAGDKARLEGLREFQHGRYQPAKSHFEVARTHYASALTETRASLELASKDRERAVARASALTDRSGCEEFQGSTLDACSTAREQLAQGDAALAEFRAADASASFRSAHDGFERAAEFQASNLRTLAGAEAAAQAAASADAVRKEAVEAGALENAREPLTRADGLRETAARATAGDRHEDAERGYREASALYASARDASASALEQARASGESVSARGQKRLDRGGCERLSAAAMGVCNSGMQAIALAQEALEQQRAAAATDHFRDAEAAFARADAAESAHLASLPKPPRLESRTPGDSAVTVNRNQEVTFTITASDPNGDALRYAWSDGDQRLSQDGPRITLRPQRSTRVSVEVSDGAGGSQQATWDVTVQNRMPKLTLTPRASETQLQVGEAITFRTTSSDADGDSVSVRFSLDGVPVGDGSSFKFRAAEAGSFVVRATATDSAGAETNAERTVRVRPVQLASIEPPPLPEARPTKPAKPPRPEPAKPVEPSPEDKTAKAREGARLALAEYEAAYEAGDVERLSRVWLMNPKQYDSMRRFFTVMNDIGVDLEGQEFRVGDETVSVDFDQRVVAQGLTPSTAPLTAVLVRRSDKWAISSIGPRR